MTEFAWMCSHESYQPEELLEQARLAEEVGFDAVLSSDVFHPCGVGWTVPHRSATD